MDLRLFRFSKLLRACGLYDSGNVPVRLRATGVMIDTLTDEQLKYLNSWQEGT